MKLLLDMNLSPQWTTSLTQAGHVAVHWCDVGRADALDREIMEYAVREGYVVLTHDMDFGAMLAAFGLNGPSVVQIRADQLQPAAILQAILAGLSTAEDALMQGALVTIDLHRTRIRILPLGG